MISTGINLVMTVIGFAVSTMFIVFVCTRLICARIQLRASRRNFPTASRSALSAVCVSLSPPPPPPSKFLFWWVLERGLHGLEPVLVASFPTMEFGDHFISSGQDTQCTVCLAEYQPKDVLCILPYCRHAFHVSCIDLWLKQHSTCPLCRISLRDSPDRKRTMPPVYSGAIRSMYNPREPFELDSYHYLYAGENYPEMAENNQRMESSQDDSVSSEPSISREVPSPYVGGNFPVKMDSHEDPKGKHMESPSDS